MRRGSNIDRQLRAVVRLRSGGFFVVATIIRGLLIAALTVLALSTVFAQSKFEKKRIDKVEISFGKAVIDAAAGDPQTCEQASGDEAIAACTRAIASGAYQGHDLAKLHYDRAFEYRAKRDNG